MTHTLRHQYQTAKHSGHGSSLVLVPPILPDRDQRAETVHPIISAAPAPLQSVLSRIRSTTPAGGAHEVELRLLLAFVLLGAVVAATTVLVAATRSGHGQVG